MLVAGDLGNTIRVKVASTLRTIGTDDVLFVRADRTAQLLPPQAAARFSTGLEAAMQRLRGVSPLRAFAAWRASGTMWTAPRWLTVLIGRS